MPSELEYGDEIDASTFEQILEMDDDDDKFSMSLFVDFKSQAKQTLANLDAYVDAYDKNEEIWQINEGDKNGEIIEPNVDTKIPVEAKLTELSHGGHYLKGSSATLGFTKVQEGCSWIQHYGHHQDKAGNPSNDSNDVLLQKIKETIAQVKKDLLVVSKRVDEFYGL